MWTQNTGACPEDKEEEKHGRLDSEWLYQSHRWLPEEEVCGEVFGLRPLLNTGACPEEEEEEERSRSFGLAVTALALQVAAQRRRRVVSCLDLK